jgi:hypothetical protein
MFKRILKWFLSTNPECGHAEQETRFRMLKLSEHLAYVRSKSRPQIRVQRSLDYTYPESSTINYAQEATHTSNSDAFGFSD